jgi:hypothetical protein
VALGVGVLGFDRVGEGEDHLAGVLEPVGRRAHAEHAADPRLQLGGVGRKADHLVGAMVVGRHRGLRRGIGEGDHRQQPGRGGALDAPAGRDAVGRAFLPKIEQHHRGLDCQEGLRGVGDAAGLDDGPSTLERFGNLGAEQIVARQEEP